MRLDDVHLVLVDDEELVTEVLRMSCSEIVGNLTIFSNVEEAVRQAPGLDRQKDDRMLWVVDMHFEEGSSGVDLCQWVKTNNPDDSLLVLSKASSPGFIWRAFQELGVFAYIVKNRNAASEVRVAIEAFGRSEGFENEYSRYRDVENPSPLRALTERQLTVIKQAAMGFSTNEIAMKTDVTAQAVRHTIKGVEKRMRLDWEEIIALGKKYYGCESR